MITLRSVLVLFILLTLLLTGATLAPSDRLPGNRFMLYDKAIHFAAFGAWSFLLYLVEYFRNKRSDWGNYIYCVIVTSSYGLLIEILQTTLPVNRSADVYDWLADIFGALFFTAVAIWFSEKFLDRD